MRTVWTKVLRPYLLLMASVYGLQRAIAGERNEPLFTTAVLLSIPLSMLVAHLYLTPYLTGQTLYPNMLNALFWCYGVFALLPNGAIAFCFRDEIYRLWREKDGPTFIWKGDWAVAAALVLVTSALILLLAYRAFPESVINGPRD